jgi:hypothetical protein
MSILETLHLRMAGDDLDHLVELVRRATAPPGSRTSLEVFRHSRIQGDLLIQLHRAGPDQTIEPSELGVRLASLLRIHGLVDHSVWVSGGESQDSV